MNKRQRIIEKYNGRCQICFKETNKKRIKDYPELDHIIPRSKGGDNSENNLILLCNDCNNKRSNLHGNELIRKIIGEFGVDDFLIKQLSYEVRNGNLNESDIFKLIIALREKVNEFQYELFLIAGEENG